MYVSLSKYLLALAGHVLSFDAGGIGDAGENTKVNASMDLLGKSKDLLLDILDNPFGSSPSISSDSDISILASSRCISIDSDLSILKFLSDPLVPFLSSKKAFASRWSCSIVN